MLVQCPPCGTRYRISARRVGPDGRALSRCVACGTWVVVHCLESGLLEIRTADELVGKRSILALDYVDWADDVSERATMPMALPADELPDDALLSAPGALDLGIVRIEASEGPTDWRSSQATEVTAATPADDPIEDEEVLGGSPMAPTAVLVEELPEAAFFPAAPPAAAPPELPAANPDLGALELNLPDPRRRRRSRVEVQAMLSEFSVMFRLDNRARRRKTLISAAAVVAVCAIIVVVVALSGGAVAPATSKETRTLVTTLQARHADGVEHTQTIPGEDGKQKKRSLSLLATQLLQLNKGHSRGEPDGDAAAPQPAASSD